VSGLGGQCSGCQQDESPAHPHNSNPRPASAAALLRHEDAATSAAGVRKGFYDPYSNYGHYGRLESDGISEWHPSFLTLAPTLKGCSKRYERFCQKYRHHSKGAPKCHWGSRMLKRLVETSGSRSKRKRLSPEQQQLPFASDCRLNQIPEDWHQIAVRFRRANGIRDGDRERSNW
jgi:putative transposase